jgi:hypothetical protein
MIQDNKTRAKLVELLPKNYRAVVAKRTGCHPNTVYNVLYKENDNEVVEDAILKLYEEEKIRRKSRAKKVKSTVTQS